jgi:hypothetical protein
MLANVADAMPKGAKKTIQDGIRFVTYVVVGAVQACYRHSSNKQEGKSKPGRVRYVHPFPYSTFRYRRWLGLNRSESNCGVHLESIATFCRNKRQITGPGLKDKGLV